MLWAVWAEIFQTKLSRAKKKNHLEQAEPYPLIFDCSARSHHYFLLPSSLLESQNFEKNQWI